MEIQGDNESGEARRPVQFDLSKLIQFLTVAALWCSVGIVRDKVTLGMAYAVVTAITTWAVVGRWAVSLSPKTCRRVLVFTTALLVAGGTGVTMLVGHEEYLPLVCLLTVFLASLLAELVPGIPNETVWASIICVSGALLFLVVYSVWLLVFRVWDRWSSRPSPHRWAWSFSAFIAVLMLPLLLSVSGGCYSFTGHGHSHNEVRHVWLHCVLHVGMLVSAGVIIGLLQRRACHSTGLPPNWLKLLTLGYLCLYAVLLQVALFPVNFTMP